MDHNEGQQDNLQSEASISQREKGTSSSSGINHGVDTQPKPNSERSFQYVLMLKKQKSSRVYDMSHEEGRGDLYKFCRPCT